MIIGARPDALMPSMSLHCMPLPLLGSASQYIVSSGASRCLLSLQVSQYSSVISALRLLPRRPSPAVAAGFCLSSFIRPSFMHVALDVKVNVHKNDLGPHLFKGAIHFAEKIRTTYTFDSNFTPTTCRITYVGTPSNHGACIE